MLIRGAMFVPLQHINDPPVRNRRFRARVCRGTMLHIQMFAKVEQDGHRRVESSQTITHHSFGCGLDRGSAVPLGSS